MHERRDTHAAGRTTGGYADALCPFEQFRFREETNTYEVRYDDGAIPASIAVIGAMSRVLDNPPEHLASLGGIVDLEALDALMAGESERAACHASVSFDYYEHDVTVRTGGEITVRERSIEGVEADARGRAGRTTG